MLGNPLGDRAALSPVCLSQLPQGSSSQLNPCTLNAQSSSHSFGQGSTRHSTTLQAVSPLLFNFHNPRLLQSLPGSLKPQSPIPLPFPQPQPASGDLRLTSPTSSFVVGSARLGSHWSCRQYGTRPSSHQSCLASLWPCPLTSFLTCYNEQHSRYVQCVRETEICLWGYIVLLRIGATSSLLLNVTECGLPNT